jgi:hypothetical protein
LSRYQGINWADTLYHQCNGGINPSGPQGNDGLELDPLEVRGACFT